MRIMDVHGADGQLHQAEPVVMHGSYEQLPAEIRADLEAGARAEQDALDAAQRDSLHAAAAWLLTHPHMDAGNLIAGQPHVYLVEQRISLPGGELDCTLMRAFRELADAIAWAQRNTGPGDLDAGAYWALLVQLVDQPDEDVLSGVLVGYVRDSGRVTLNPPGSGYDPTVGDGPLPAA